MASNAVATTVLLSTSHNRLALRSPQPIAGRTQACFQTAAYSYPARGALVPDRAGERKAVDKAGQLIVLSY
jgi:hypothetical protein